MSPQKPDTAHRNRQSGNQSIEKQKSTTQNALSVRDCSLMPYRQTLQLQQQLVDQRRKGKIPNTVLLVEHPPVITLGARESANMLLATPKQLAQQNIDLVRIRRGGGATAHNPGQLVFYPILALSDLGLGINEYIRKLESVGTELLNHLGVHSQSLKGFPGLWIGKKKIASIGVRVSKLVTFHGMAINIQNDLSIFDLFVPCGLEGVEMTSVYKETGKHNPMNRVKSKLISLLIKHFSNQDLAEYEQSV